MKTLPFDIEKIKAGAKCVDQHGDTWTFEDEDGKEVPFLFKRVKDGYLSWRYKGGAQFSAGHQFDLFVLDPYASHWNPISGPDPTEADLDEAGEVIAWTVDKGSVGVSLKIFKSIKARILFWMRTPPLPFPEKSFEKDFLEKLDENGKFLYSCMSDGSKHAAKQQWEAKNL